MGGSTIALRGHLRPGLALPVHAFVEKKVWKKEGSWTDFCSRNKSGKQEAQQEKKDNARSSDAKLKRFSRKGYR
jgi:hypothetical protein